MARRFAVHGVVEIARRLAVDGDQRQMPDILASGEILLQHLGREFFRLIRDFRRERVRQVMLAQRDLDFHAGIGVAAQHLGHLPDGLVVRTRLGEDFHHHHLARLRAAGMLGRHQDVLVDAAVLRDQKTDPPFAIIAADDETVDVLQHLDDLRLAPAAPVEAGDAHQHAVAMQHTVHFLGGKVKVVAILVGHDEAEAVGMPFHPSLDEIELVGQQQQALAVDHQLGVTLHRAQAALEQVALGFGDVQLRDEDVQLDRVAGLGQQLQDVFAAGQRRFVALDLPFIERVGEADRRNRVPASAATGFFCSRLR